MTRSEAQEKIRKLLQSKGRTDAEAYTAAILAAAIAAKHNVDIAELDRADQSTETTITHHQFGHWAITPDEATYASLICKRFFEVSPFTQSGYLTGEEMIVVGTEQHLTVARYVFEFLIGEFRRAWNRRTNKRLKKRKAFIYAAFVALWVKLDARFAQPAAPQLELALEVNLKAKREKYLSETFGKLKSSYCGPRNKKSRSGIEGYQAGNGIEIRPGVETSAPTRGALGPPTKLLTA